MKVYQANQIRNITFMGHSGNGKTSLIEALIYNTKATKRMGNVSSGNTVTDFTEEEIERGGSINTTYAFCEWKGCKLNLIDTPGDFDFASDQRLGLRVGDIALIVASAREKEVSVGSDKAMRMAAKSDNPVAIYVNRVDEQNAKFEDTVKAYQDVYGKKIVPLCIPIMDGQTMAGYVDVLSNKGFKLNDNGAAGEMEVPTDLQEVCKQYHDELMEQIASSSEELMMKFFDEEPFTDQEIFDGMETAILDGALVPVFAGTATGNRGVNFLLDTIVDYFPKPSSLPPIGAQKQDGTEVELPCDPNGPLAAYVFKTIIDPFVGRISLLRIFSGTFKAEGSVYNMSTDTEERVPGLFIMRGKEQIAVDKLEAGDIGGISKLENTLMNQTLSSLDQPLVLEPAQIPEGGLTMAVTSSKRGDEDKVMQGLNRLQEEDPSFRVYNDAETSQVLITGQGETQMQILLKKLKLKFDTEAILQKPKIAYRETIRNKVEVQGKHKKQSGGHGQYGDVWIRFEPGEQEALEFAEEVVGGSVPKNYFPAVEKGLLDAVKHGTLAGYPVVNLKAVLYDGSYHPVDSNDMSFQQAARLAYRNGIPKANPIILEPINALKVHIPDEALGDIMGDISKRRGRILGMGVDHEETGYQIVEAEAPASELISYATDLRSMTQGRGFFSSEFVRYEQVPSDQAEKIIADAQAEDEE